MSRDLTKPKYKTTIAKRVYDPSVVKRLEEEKRESKAKDKTIYDLEKELSNTKSLHQQEKAEREKLNHQHEKMISDLKHARWENLDKTLKEENDRLKHQIDKITIEKEDLGTEVDRLRTREQLKVFPMQDRDLKAMEAQNYHLNKLLIAQGEDIKELSKRDRENLTTIEDLRNSAHIDKETIKQLKQKTEELSRLLTEDRELNENFRTKNHKELMEKDQDITELQNEKARLKDETKQLKQELKKIKNKAQTGVDKTETTASEQTDINISPSPNRFAQCPIVEGKWSSEKDTELLSLQEQNKSYEESMMSMLKAKRIKEDENSKLKTKVQQLEMDFLKKAKEVDSLKIEKQTLEERLNKQTKE